MRGSASSRYARGGLRAKGEGRVRARAGRRPHRNKLWCEAVPRAATPEVVYGPRARGVGMRALGGGHVIMV